MDHDFLTNTLLELAPKYGVPKSVIPKLAHLMREYPNLNVHGTKTRLRRDLEKIIKTVVQEGK